MVVNKLKKKVKYRGSKTHGCGSMKKRRGAGHRGGRGAAGSGKRGDAKKPSIWNEKYFGSQHSPCFIFYQTQCSSEKIPW